MSACRMIADMHDAFEWWAEIWIPLSVGAATVFLSIVALVASARATRLAHEVERQREAAAEERAADERRQRVQGMALAEARALTRWVMVATEDSGWHVDSVERTGEARHGPTLAQEARVALRQSLVPGASELLEVTEFEIENFHDHTPHPLYMPDRRVVSQPPIYAHSAILSEHVPQYRRERIMSRIRDWALDPERAQGGLRADLARIREDADAFMDYRLGLGDRGLRPISELPDPPFQIEAAVEFFRAQGVLPPDDEEMEPL